MMVKNKDCEKRVRGRVYRTEKGTWETVEESGHSGEGCGARICYA